MKGKQIFWCMEAIFSPIFAQTFRIDEVQEKKKVYGECLINTTTSVTVCSINAHIYLLVIDL
jgi:hypothetical protein